MRDKSRVKKDIKEYKYIILELNKLSQVEEKLNINAPEIMDTFIKNIKLSFVIEYYIFEKYLSINKRYG